MGKRHTIVVSSSDNEDGDCSGSGTCSTSKSKLRTTVTRKKSKASKKAIVSSTQLWKESHRLEVVDFNFLLDDSCGGLRGSTADTERGYESSSRWSGTKELWVDKYKPRSLAELAVHKKKVEEVKIWLEERLKTPKENCRNHALVISGQAGVGKSATVNVIASQLGVELCEWKTPTPILWQEHIHNSNSGLQYISKLDEFENFVERIRKYPLLPLGDSRRAKKSVLLLIDDLPVTNGRAAFGRLSQCLCLLSQSTPFPTIILVTEYGKSKPGNGTSHYYDELLSSLERAGASKVAFNPPTTNTIKKALSRICREEMCNVSLEWIDHIAKGSAGDIRNAIMSLEYFCLRPDTCISLSEVKPVEGTKFMFSSVNDIEDSGDRFTLTGGRDETLSLFHALGKFLHNKRETVHATALGQDMFLLQEKFTRFPFKMDVPEKVICQAHGEARPITDFLHENVLDFVSDEAVDEAFTVASYLSDADCLLATTLNGPAGSLVAGRYDPESIAQSVAASVAVRGVLFGNSHPSPSRWHSIRSPKLWQVEQSSRRNKNQMLMERFHAYSSLSSAGLSAMATEYKPALKWLTLRLSDGLHDESACEHVDLDDLEGEEDGIEDW